MKTELQSAFEGLRAKHGSHSAAARILNINRDHYCAMRNGRANIPQRTAEFIIMKASEAEILPPVIPATDAISEARP